MFIRSTPVGYTQLGTTTSLATAQAVTRLGNANIALISAEIAALRFRDDGIAPTASIGQFLPVGVMFEYAGNIAALQVISAAGGTGICNISQYQTAGD